MARYVSLVLATPTPHPCPLNACPVSTRLAGTTAIYTLLLVYAASTATTTLACIAVVLAAPDASASDAPAPGRALTPEQRLLLLSSYVPFFLVPLVMALDMGARVHRLVGEATAARRAVKRE